MSVDYYARMERGNLSGVSDEVLEGLARALRLNDTETEHLHDLAAAAAPTPASRKKVRPETKVSDALQRFIDLADRTPVWVCNRRTDFIATNSLARAVYSPILTDPANQNNLSQFTFLNPAAHVFFPDWTGGATSMVAAIRMSAGQNPRDKDLTGLIGELVTRSDTFGTMWAAHDVRHHLAGTKQILHPTAGLLAFDFEAMELPAYPGLTMFAYMAADAQTEQRLEDLAAGEIN